MRKSTSAGWLISVVRYAGGWVSLAPQRKYTIKGLERGLEGARAIGRLSHYVQSITEAPRGYTASARRALLSIGGSMRWIC